MRVTTQFLFRVSNTTGGWVATCRPARLATEAQADRDGAARAAAHLVTGYLEAEGRDWLTRWERSDAAVTCPEGRVKLPIDLWYCKLTNEACPLQAQVLVDDQERFFDVCKADPARQRDILETVRAGRYRGAHHVPGRYLCPGCSKVGGQYTKRYRYPWELQQLANDTLASEFEPHELQHALIRAGLPINYMHSRICPDCTLHAVAKLAPLLVDEFTVIERKTAL